MIHIATVHWQTDKWIDIQLKHLNKYINEEFRVYAFLSGNAIKHKKRFFYACTEPIKEHYIKLNILADIIYFASNKVDDIIVFLDGDAFPVGDITKLIRSKIQKYKLLAIQRIENDGDIQPHPSFCATTVGFWKKIQGDWKHGYKWENNRGIYVSDVGGNLLEILNLNKIEWYPLHRTGQLDEHPLWFGIYDHVIYHHGSGFRMGSERVVAFSLGLKKIRKKPLSILLDKIPDDLIIKIKSKIHPVKRFRKKIYQKYKSRREYIYDLIHKDNINSYLK